MIGSRETMEKSESSVLSVAVQDSGRTGTAGCTSAGVRHFARISRRGASCSAVTCKSQTVVPWCMTLSRCEPSAFARTKISV
jgi:hypothetical protein